MNPFQDSHMDQTVVPLQPELSHQPHYSEKVLTWNPYSKKNFALCYQFRTAQESEPIRLIPDACVDFLFKCDPDHPLAVVSGVQTAPRELLLDPDSVYFGFKPYSPKGMRPLNASWHDLVDQRVDLCQDLKGAERVAELISAQQTFDERIAIISDFARRQLVDEDYIPDFVEYSELQVCQARGNVRMEEISDYTGYTSRYCREKFKAAHGISIKNYSSIMRFQNAVRMLSRPREEVQGLSDVVYDNGYFDQSHLNRDFRRFAGDTPLHYRKRVLCPCS